MDELPPADVWGLDCEGAEEEILRAGDPPNRVVVEVHPKLCDERNVVNSLPGPYTRFDRGSEWIAVVDRE